MPDGGVLIAIYQRVYPCFEYLFDQTSGRTLTTNDMTTTKRFAPARMPIYLPACLPACLSACLYTTIKCILEYIVYDYGTQKHVFDR